MAGLSAKFLSPFVGLKTILHLMGDETIKLSQESDTERAGLVAFVNKIKSDSLTYEKR